MGGSSANQQALDGTRTMRGKGAVIIRTHRELTVEQKYLSGSHSVVGLTELRHEQHLYSGPGSGTNPKDFQQT